MLKKTGLMLFSLLFSFSPLSSEIFYPWGGTYIGALEGPSWPGLVMILDKESAFAFVLRVEKEGKVAVGEDFLYLIGEVGPHSPDGRYARMKFDLGLPFEMGGETPVLLKPPRQRDTLTLEWSRKDEKIVIGRIHGPKNVTVSIVHYFPWDITGTYTFLDNNEVQGRSGGVGQDRFYVFWTDRSDDVSQATSGRDTRSFSFADERNLHFVAGAGDDLKTVSDQIYRYKNDKTIDAFIDEEAKGYEQKRVRTKGLFKGIAEAIGNNLHWTVLYQPGLHRLYAPTGRTGLYPTPRGETGHWTIFGGDAFFSALELTLESSKLATDVVMAILDTQYPNGNIPNWRSRYGGTTDRSQPPIGAYVVLKLFQKMGDKNLLDAAYPYLQRWHEFWTAKKQNGLPRRDGNGDGLLEWGSDPELVSENIPDWERNATGRQRAAWESGQDDLPNWDDVPYSEETGTFMMNCLDLNCLYALDSWCLTQIASLLDRPLDAERYLADYVRMRALINEHLWDNSDGFYYDRFWNGDFSKRKAASNFYALIARIPDDDQARRMLKHLLEPEKFWGDYVVPTISRDEQAFRADDQQPWRGTVWPVTNYLIYQGLKAYGFDAVGSEFARKSVDLFLRNWSNFQICPENFNSLTGQSGVRRFQSLGPLFAMIGVEEYLDFTPWEGFRFGMLKPDAGGRLSRISIQGRHYEVEVSNSTTVLREEGITIVAIDGSAVVRHFLYNESEISFEIKTLKARDIKLRFLKKGKYQILIDGREFDVISGNSCKLEVEGGNHSVMVQLLDDFEEKT